MFFFYALSNNNGGLVRFFLGNPELIKSSLTADFSRKLDSPELLKGFHWVAVQKAHNPVHYIHLFIGKPRHSAVAGANPSIILLVYKRNLVKSSKKWQKVVSEHLLILFNIHSQ